MQRTYYYRIYEITSHRNYFQYQLEVSLFLENLKLTRGKASSFAEYCSKCTFLAVETTLFWWFYKDYSAVKIRFCG